MGKVLLDMSMSLDGFIATAAREDGGLNNWYFAASSNEGDGSQQVIEELTSSLGAIIMGKRTYGLEDEHMESGGEDPYDAARVVLTHHAPATAPNDKIYFVSDGVEAALQIARDAAGDRDIAIGGGADVAQQFLRAGLVDEIQLHVVPVLFGQGVRLFEHLGEPSVELEILRVIEGQGVTHLHYRVVR